MPAKVSPARTSRGIPGALVEALDRIGRLGRYAGRGDRVLLKPNLNGVEGFTDIALTEMLIRLLLDLGDAADPGMPAVSVRVEGAP